MFTWVQLRQPGKNITRFQAFNVQSEQKIARNRSRDVQKSDLNFSGPKLAHLRPVYTGPGKFYARENFFLDRLFTWIRANSVAVVLTWVQLRQSGKRMSRFQALTVLSEQTVARFECFHESACFPKSEPCRSKSWPAFFRSQTCTLGRSKVRSVPPVPCKRNVEPYMFLSVHTFVRTLVNWALAVQKFVRSAGPVETQGGTVQFSFCPCRNLSWPV